MRREGGREGGQVLVHAGQPLAQTHYDLAVVGGGRMGLACAFYLRQLAPRARLLIVERGGIPHEEGATLNAPGVWHRADLPPEWRARAEWTRRIWADPQAETGTVRPHDPTFQASGWACFGTELGEPPEGLERFPARELLERLSPEAQTQLPSLLDLEAMPDVWYDPLGGAGSASALALSYGYGAVRLGADLLLNSEAELIDTGLRVRRLTVTRRHEIVVAETRDLQTGAVVVAAGAEGPALLEEGLGRHLPHRRAYVQTPRLNLPPAPGLPLLSAACLGLRPRDGGFQLLPPTPAPDPGSYEPSGGRLAGVPTGTRRELLDTLLGALPSWPALAAGGLDLGKTVTDVPGAWVALPHGGWPLAEEAAPGRWLLLGGPQSDRVGLAVAYELAARIAGTSGRPWD